ncbi:MULTISPECIES: hypothetical protein [Deinococcus]|uniref:Uncharacterized protein n=1 Tax=Deinococcus sedimenti TaxID=1867090 RepID=A0ABQ2S933_9DEIO|nr:MULTISPECIES: hypothetical protein [Deinococcus]MDK2014519.1 hypothetical protein [Deinococcus sp. 43]GGS00791.1 hypothetical protein GCM10008960_29410 [Deinococcus sedimenti]
MTQESTFTPAALPRVERILPGSTPQRLSLELTSGDTLTLDEGTRAVLLPSQWLLAAPHGELSVLSLWARPGAPAYAVPDALLPDLLPYFND